MIIPDRHEVPLRTLATMSVSDRKKLVLAFESPSPVTDSDSLVQQAVAATNGEEKDVTKLVFMFLSMYRAAEGAPRAFAKSVSEATCDLLGSANPNVDWQAFTDDLTSLLECDESIGIAAKTLDVRQEYPKVFCSSRVLSDIRPVFGKDPTSPPLAGAVMHVLRLSYHKSSEHREFYVALDAADLRQLRSVLDRATKKEESLRKQIEESGMVFLEAGDV